MVVLAHYWGEHESGGQWMVGYFAGPLYEPFGAPSRRAHQGARSIGEALMFGRDNMGLGLRTS